MLCDIDFLLTNVISYDLLRVSMDLLNRWGEKVKNIYLLVLAGFFSTQICAYDQIELDNRRLLLGEVTQQGEPYVYSPPTAPAWEEIEDSAPRIVPKKETITEQNLRLLRENTQLKQQLDQNNQRLSQGERLILDYLQHIKENISAQQLTIDSIDMKQTEISDDIIGLKKSVKKLTHIIDSNPSHPLHKILNNFRFLVCLTSGVSTGISVYGTTTWMICLLPASIAPPVWLPGMVAIASGGIIFISNKWQI